MCGNFFATSFDIFKGNQVIATVRKQSMTGYELTIDKERTKLVVAGLVLCLLL
ncbi:MAG: hypothetical protein LBM95_03505 [Lactobacillales bacterium]|nr:hypothetical protein [Lactobacillales bacterium]